MSVLLGQPRVSTVLEETHLQLHWRPSVCEEVFWEGGVQVQIRPELPLVPMLKLQVYHTTLIVCGCLELEQVAVWAEGKQGHGTNSSPWGMLLVHRPSQDRLLVEKITLVFTAALLKMSFI